jgi:hypothetical protein
MNLEKKEDIAAYYRGLLIQDTIDLELRMEIIIGRFLSKNNQDKVIDLIEIFDIAMIDFSQKIKILKYIVKKYLKNFPTGDRKNFFSDLTYVMERRNELAHRRQDKESNDYLKLTWTKTDNDKLKIVELNLSDEFKTEFKEKSANSYIRLIELEGEVVNLT